MLNKVYSVTITFSGSIATVTFGDGTVAGLTALTVTNDPIIGSSGSGGSGKPDNSVGEDISAGAGTTADDSIVVYDTDDYSGYVSIIILTSAIAVLLAVKLKKSKVKK